MKKIGLLLTAILLSPLAMAQTAPAAPKAQALQTWYVAPIVIDQTSEAQKALTDAGNFVKKLFGKKKKKRKTIKTIGSVQIVRELQQHGLMVLGSGLTDPDFSLLGAAHLFAWSGIARPCAGPRPGSTAASAGRWPTFARTFPPRCRCPSSPSIAAFHPRASRSCRWPGTSA